MRILQIDAGENGFIALNRNNGNSVRFYDGDGGELMRITPDGQLGIGTANPERTLHVDGSAVIQSNLGVGTTNPINLLHVAGTTRTQFLILSDDPLQLGDELCRGSGGLVGMAAQLVLIFSAYLRNTSQASKCEANSPMAGWPSAWRTCQAKACRRRC